MQHLADTTHIYIVRIAQQSIEMLQLGSLLFLCATMKTSKAATLQSCSWTRRMTSVVATHNVKAVCDGNIGYGSRLKVNVGQ